MKNEYLIISDFDGTVADTFVPSPNNIGVNEAYMLAIEAIFKEEGMEAYKSIGMLKNRAPLELVIALLQYGQVSLIEQAKNFFKEKANPLETYAPDDKKIPLVWDSKNPEKTITEILVRVKLFCLLKEICSAWPKPCAGFLDFIESFKDASSIKDANIRIAILSAGHEMFIKKTFDVWGMGYPSIMLTDDNLRMLSYPTDPKEKMKPSVSLLNLIHYMWVDKQRTTDNTLELIDLIMKTRNKMIYFGDDVERDGQLAQRAKIPFVLFDPKKEVSYRKNNNFLLLNNWSDMATFMRRTDVREAFQSGKDFSEIVSLF